MSEKKKSKLTIELEYRAFMLAVGIIRLLPLNTAYRLADGISRLFYIFDFKHRNRTIRHILHSGIRTDLESARSLARENFRHMVKLFVEIVKFDQIVNEDNFYDYISIASDPASQKMLNPETTFQIILTTAHLGNWELAGGAHSHITGIPMCSIMRPLGNYKIGEYIYSHRSSFQHRTVSKERGLRPLIEANKKGENVTIVADQHASKKEGVDVMFFGHPARAHATPALLHLKTGTPLAMPYLIRTGNFKFEFHCPEPISYTPTGDKERDVRNLTQLYTIMIEKEIRRFPEQWLWAHRRWLDCERGHDDYQIPPEEMSEVLLKGKEDTP